MLTEAQLMALELFKDEIPCMMMGTTEACEEKATKLAELAHQGADCGQFEPNPSPFCDRHAAMIKAAFNPFIQMFGNVAGIPCGCCGTAMMLIAVTPI